MFPNFTQYEVIVADRRQRYQADARRHRFLGSVRRHRPVAVGGATSPVALPTTTLGRTPSDVARHAA
jgi:hypothetical protein